jgi:hypothetical protein
MGRKGSSFDGDDLGHAIPKATKEWTEEEPGYERLLALAHSLLLLLLLLLSNERLQKADLLL